MKKRILTVAVAALALAACSKNETVEVADSNLIGFEGAFVGKATRAGLPVDGQFGGENNIKQFFVFGNTAVDAVVFNNIKVYEQNGEWVYDVLKQWESNNTYKFAAYSVTDESGLTQGTPSFKYDTHTLSIADYVSNDNHQRDLLVAASLENLKNVNRPVPFTFKHALAMVKFTLGSSLGDKNPITITGFKVEGMHTKGNLDVVVGSSNDAPTITWSNQEAETQAVPFTDSTWTNVTTSTPVASDEFVVIPQELSGNLTITFTVEVAGLSPKTLTATIENPKWEAGNRYNYKATITGTDVDVIEFADPIVGDWGDYGTDIPVDAK